MPLMLRNRYAKDIGGISIGQKIIHNKPQEGVVLTPSVGIGGLKHKINSDMVLSRHPRFGGKIADIAGICWWSGDSAPSAV